MRSRGTNSHRRKVTVESLVPTILTVAASKVAVIHHRLIEGNLVLMMHLTVSEISNYFNGFQRMTPSLRKLFKKSVNLLPQSFLGFVPNISSLLLKSLSDQIIQ